MKCWRARTKFLGIRDGLILGLEPVRTAAHMGEHMSKVAITNAILRWPKKLDEKRVIWSTFTDPEFAHLGESEADLKRRQVKYSTYRFPFEKLDRAITETETTGEVKVFADRSGRILGTSILGGSCRRNDR